MAMLRLGNGQMVQVSPQEMEAARSALRQVGAPDDMPALAAFLRAGKEPSYRQALPQLAASGKLPPQVTAAVQTYYGGGAATVSEGGLPLPSLPGLRQSQQRSFIGANPLTAMLGR